MIYTAKKYKTVFVPLFFSGNTTKE